MYQNITTYCTRSRDSDWRADERIWRDNDLNTNRPERLARVKATWVALRCCTSTLARDAGGFSALHHERLAACRLLASLLGLAAILALLV